MTKTHRLLVSDGVGEVIEMDFSMEEISGLIGGALLLGACASQEIEGEKPTYPTYKKHNIPRELLKTS